MSANLSMTVKILLKSFTDKDSSGSIQIDKIFLRECKILIGRFTDKDSPCSIVIQRLLRGQNNATILTNISFFFFSGRAESHRNMGYV